MYATEENLLDRYISKKVGKARISGVLYVTDFTRPCLLSAYLGIVAPVEFSVEKRRVFKSGNIIEAFLIDALNALPDTHVFSTQVPAYYKRDNLEIHGRIDALVQHKRGPLVLHEIKSIKSLYYLKEPIAEHVDQMQFYLNVLGLEYGRLDYVDKTVLLGGMGAVVDRSFSVKRDPEVFTRLLEKAEELSCFIREREKPPPCKCWLCQYCLHRDACP